MTTVKTEVVRGVKPLGVGFIGKVKATKATINEMKKIAEAHGACCGPCEVPKLADYLEGVEAHLEWFLNQLHESSEV
jgi:hypothetical protein